ncbi:MAG: asparaginyl/glutamyl-tRNA amidotransferase subunit C [Betaproteobacteria bacterium RIFCSPLOWO2_12_FULL_67_28]|nr:MAG: asparaginyl/glutamyl-tRNA amidotransferase subunit C [Betaproteobacteria bacterium RIFCSPLOWO2_02_FULL_68_150]OGA57191.1 MAG: asparaginyl/glutamyl-tRNA amidotransferase subunit C [Betaproteobacteria bacterium RIFCSPLOWO2_12_FULL_67_28]
MPLSPEQIQRLARLARVAVSPEESSAVREQLNRVLKLIDELRAVDTTGIEPMSHPVAELIPAGQRLRDDEVTESDCHAEYQSVAPAVERGLYLVPKVIE